MLLCIARDPGVRLRDIAATLGFVYLLNPATGPVNKLLGVVGIDGPNWFQSPTWSKPSLVLLAIAGASDVISAVFRNTILQLSVPDHLRGRLSSIHIAVVTGGPRVGDAESGLVAGLTNPGFAVVSGGLACIVGALAIGKLMPKLTDWRFSQHDLEEIPEELED